MSSDTIVKTYPKDHWVAARFDVAGPDPIIYVQRPDGGVLARLTGYRGKEAMDHVLALVKKGPIGDWPTAVTTSIGGFVILGILAFVIYLIRRS